MVYLCAQAAQVIEEGDSCPMEETIIAQANLATILLAIGKIQGVQEAQGNQCSRIESSLVQLRTDGDYKHRDNQTAIAELRDESRAITEALRVEVKDTLEQHCADDDRRFERLNRFMWGCGGTVVAIQLGGTLWAIFH